MTTHPGFTERDAALDLFQQHRPTLIAECREAMKALYRKRCIWDSMVAGPLAAGHYVTGDDAVNWLKDHHYVGDRRIVGAIFRPRGLNGWKWVGDVHSLDRTCHGRRKAAWVWQG